MLPDFFVIGAAKCGTTTLCTLLGRHPDVFMSDPKEIHYFGRDDPEKTRSWYEAHFDRAAEFSAVGEGSTSYTHPHIIERCAAELVVAVPEARLIYMVRDPLRRLESDWKMRKHERWAPPGSINEAALEEDTTLIGHGLYWKNLNVYRRRFADEQLLVVFLEDLARSPEDVLRRCFVHIGVDPDATIEESEFHGNRSKDFRRDSWLSSRLRRFGVMPLLRRFVPEGPFSLAKELLTRPDRYTVRWDPVVRREVLDSFVDDTRALLSHCGKPPDFWSSFSTIS